MIDEQPASEDVSVLTAGSRTSDYDYELPEEHIAQRAAEPRDASRMMVLDRAAGTLAHRTFRDLAELIPAGDAIVVNTTRVFRARLLGARDSGGPAEILLLRPIDDTHFEAMVHPGGKLRPGKFVTIAPGFRVEIVDTTARRTRIVKLHTTGDASAAIEAHGGRLIVMASRALVHVADGPADYERVYDRILAQSKQPVILHWLGEMFDPALAGYWGSSSVDAAMETALGVIAANPGKVDGVKISLLDKNKEIAMRRRLPEGVRMYTGDDFDYAELIAGDGVGAAQNQRHSDALLGIFDAIAPGKVHAVSSASVAEMTKLLENTFRSVNIALVNELALLCERMELDIWEVIAAASTKPFGYMPFYPGPGLGGHCIPIDPLYLSWKMRGLKMPARFIELADMVNTAMPEHVVSLVASALNDDSKAMKGANVLISGVAYKRNVSDVRESPAIDVIEGLLARGVVVSYLDPWVPSFKEGKHVFESMKADASFSSYDAIVIVTDHASIDYARMVKEAKVIVDTRNATRTVAAEAKARIVRL